MLFEALIMSAYLELGWLPQNGITTYQADQLYEFVDYSNYLYIDIDAEIQLSIFWIGGGMMCYFNPYPSDQAVISFRPGTMDYRFRCGLTIGPLIVGFRHVCRHPAVPDLAGIGRVTFARDSSTSEIFARVEISNR